MQEKELKKIADGILSDFASQDMTLREAIKVLQMVEGKIRTARAEMFEEVERASMTEALKEKNGYSSLVGNSAKM